MPRTQLSVQTPTRSGTVLPPAAAMDVANGNYFQNSGKTFMAIFNGGASPYNVTVTLRFGQVDGQQAPAKVVSIAASANVLLGPYPVAIYGDQVWVDGANASLTVRVYEPTTL